ncbi:MAG TPA: GAF domain-containing protein [Terriglobia bacterium]|nr:GAF domain-containing protein [Terriglobia bacterium]
MLQNSEIDFLHEIGSRIAGADPLHDVLNRVVELASTLVRCDSCFVYMVEGDELVLRASKNPHPEVVDRLKLRMSEGITGWVAEHRQPVVIERNASDDRRFQFFSELPEDRYQAFLSLPILCRDRSVGVINLQNLLPHAYTPREIKLISTVGFLVGAEIERVRLESENSELSDQLRTRKLVERAKGIMQREYGLTEEEAYLTLQRQSRQRRKPMKEIAEAIVLAEDVRRGQRTD